MINDACPICESDSPSVTDSEIWRRCGGCEAMVFRRADGPKVLIAHESEEMSQQLGAVLLAENFWPLRAADGAAANSLLDSVSPGAAVLDVGLSVVSTFEVIERLRNHPPLADIKVVLLASVFNKTAYKRKPTSLYGADDYVEQHHIPDLLPAKLSRLLGFEPVTISRGMRETIDRIAAAHRRQDLYGPRRVRVLAQAIVADIALYHESEIQTAISSRDQ